MNKYFFISILVSVLISGLFSYSLFNGKISLLTSGLPIPSQAENNQPSAPEEIMSVVGSIAEIMDDKYAINTNEGEKIIVRVGSWTTYATSFSPTRVELEALYKVATSTSEGKPLLPKLILKAGDHVEVTYSVSTTARAEFDAKTIKLIR